MRLALDAMGGDHAPQSAVDGAILFAREFPDHHVVLVGDERQIGRVASYSRHRLFNVSVRHASDVIGMDEAPTRIRKKKDSSLSVCFRMLKENDVRAVVSAGNSGAVMAGALFEWGRMPHLERPAIATLFPALGGKGRCLLLDSGANTECTAPYLAQFAVMGEAYVRAVLRIRRPRVGLLSNGEEEGKGTPLTQSAWNLLKQSNLDFVGYVEGKDLFSGVVDVAVTDGFTGNVVLKATEGAAMAVAGLLRRAVENSGLSEKLGGLLLKPALAGMQRVVDYAEYGGAPLLGVNGVGIVAHGRSSPKAIKSALKAAVETVECNVQTAIAKALEEAQGWLAKDRVA